MYFKFIQWMSFILFYSILFYSILFYSILFYSIPGLCSCTEKVKWNMATQSYDCVIMNWHYSCSLDFANVLWVMWSTAVVSKVTSFNSCISNMLCHYSPVVTLCFDAVYLHISANFFYIQFQALSYFEQNCNAHQWHCLPITASLVACHFITSSHTFRLAQ
jgi:hypothetical protein